MRGFARLSTLVLTALGVAAPVSGSAQGTLLRDETPLDYLLEVIVTSREVVAIDGRGSRQTAIPLRLGEEVLWTGNRGKVGVALTDQRVLAVATESTSWRQAPYQRAEVPPQDALLGDRVALVLTSKRALGFTGGSVNLVEYRLGPREAFLAAQAGVSVAVVVTDRRALGLSPDSGGLSEAKLNLYEHVENVTARANLATVTTNRRILIFRGPTGRWEQRSLPPRRRLPTEIRSSP